MPNARYLYLLLLTMGMFAFSSCAKKTVNLKFNPAKGSKYEYNFEYTVAQDYAGKKSKTVLKADMAMVVTGEEGPYKLVQTQYNRFAMTSDGASGKFEYDTDLPAPNAETVQANPSQMINRIFHALRHKPFQVKINQLGQVTEVKGIDSILKQMTAMIVSDLHLPAAQQEEILQTARGQFNDDAIRDMMNQMFNFYPPDVVKKGDEWTNTINSKQGLPFVINNKFKVHNITRSVVSLALESTMESSGLSDGDKLAGRQSGQIEVDPGSGMLSNSFLVQELKGMIQGMEVQMTTNTLSRGKQL